MRYRTFGSTDLTVSELGFGCARLGAVFQSATRADDVRTLQRALDQGITFFDTSDMYCQGESEVTLGRAVRGRRSQVVLASKVGYCLPTQRKVIARVKPLVRPVVQRLGIKREHLPSAVRGELSQDFSAAYILRAAEQSLRRLRTDYLDLYQLHSPPRQVLERGDFLAPLEKMKRDGKIRYFGVSCETSEDALVCLQHSAIASLQIRLSLLDQSALDTVVPRARERGVALIARECFAGGLLTKPIAPTGTEAPDTNADQASAKRYGDIVEHWRRPLPEVALRFVLGIEGISVALAGIRTEAHLRDNVRYAQGSPLADEQLQALRWHRAA